MKNSELINKDVVIIGAGPGAVQLAVSLYDKTDKKNIDLVLLERNGIPGSFFKKYPVHGTLISNNKLYTGAPYKSRFAERFDWNSLITKEKNQLMRNYCRDFYPKSSALVDMMQDVVKEYDLPIEYNTTCEKIEKIENGKFMVTTNTGTYITPYVVVATGLKPYTAPIKGIEHATPYEDVRDKEYYRDKRVLILGKGNSGMEMAQDIMNEASTIMMASRKSIKPAYASHYVGNVRAVNFLMVENYMLKHQSAMLDCDIVEIVPAGKGYNVTVNYNHAECEVETINFDEIICTTGFVSDLDCVLNGIKIKQLHGGKFPSINGEFESTDVSNLFFAGAQTHGLDYRQTSSSGFVHGFRYNSQALANILLEKLNLNITAEVIDKKDFAKHIFNELKNDAAIYLQSGMIIQVYEWKEDEEAWTNLGYRTLKWYAEAKLKNKALLGLSLEYGDIHAYPDPLSIPRFPGQPEKSVHLHPVVRFRSDDFTSMIDLEENLENNFTETECNVELLDRFLDKIHNGDAAMLTMVEKNKSTKVMPEFEI